LGYIEIGQLRSSSGIVDEMMGGPDMQWLARDRGELVAAMKRDLD
jgi:hypothetical protein